MSLIQEALKRQQEENDGTAAPVPNVEKPMPPKQTPLVRKTENTPEEPPKSVSNLIKKRQPEPTETAGSRPQPKEETKKTEAPKPEMPKPAPQPAIVQPPAPTPPASDIPKKKIKVKDNQDNKTIQTSEKKPAEKKLRSEKPALIGMIVLLMLMISAIGYAIIFGLEYAGIKMPWTASPVATESSNTKQEASSKPEKIAAAASTANKETPKKIEPKKVKTAKNEQAKQNNKPTAPKAVKVVSKPKSKTTPATVKTAAETKVPAVWPIVKLKAILGIGRGGAIMLDNKIIGVGEKYKGITVIKIESRGALLEFEKEQRFLKMSKTTE